MGRLLALSEARIAAELRRVRAADDAERVWRRRLVKLGLRCALLYLAGLGILGLAFHTTDLGVAQVAFDLGRLVALVAPGFTAFLFWQHENQ